MEDMQTTIILLSIIVGILSLFVLVLLGVTIALLVKLRAVMNRVDKIAQNVAEATEWLSPTKVFGSITKLFKKH